MPRLIDLGLEKLTHMIFDMFKLAETSISNSLDAYKNRDGVSSEKILDTSDQLRILKEEASSLAVEILARYQPLASDLRFIKSCIDIAYDLARFGRYAYDISLTPDWLGDLSHCDLTVPEKMAQKAIAMIGKSLDAFKNRDAELAKTLPDDDDLIDQEYKDVIISLLNKRGIKRECALSVALLVRHIERIADHACYIADAVVYIVEGERLGLH
jgi:phosphate transport system protein